MKVVFDTNVYVAEALDGETARRILTSTERASWRIYISQYIVHELVEVMTEDLALPRRSALLAATRVTRRASMVAPMSSRHTVPQDPADSDILRTALAASADFLVTNDRHLLALHPYEGLRIITMTEYRGILEEQRLFL
jgi:putative PIN family toxin of toxin-antitoxin system